MIKLTILESLTRDFVLQTKIFNSLEIRQDTIGQSFRRCIKNGKPSGQSHSEPVLAIIKAHLNINDEQLFN
jgi:hypothetical protein